jgi:glyoxylase-like metal-dependent hydrolase (beta-lactamase superfamily II)
MKIKGKAPSKYFLGNTFPYLLVAGTFFMYACSKSGEVNATLPITSHPNRVQDFSLWQLAAFNDQLQMGYIIKSDDGKITVIDGGVAVTVPYLETYIDQLGGQVNYWIVTHPHPDHVNALVEILQKKLIKIDTIIHSEQDVNWINKNEPTAYKIAAGYYNAVKASGIPVINASLGEEKWLGDGVIMKVLHIKNEAITFDAVNNSSMAFSVKSNNKTVLFLGDLGVEGGQELEANFEPTEINADYVQMAHHGQAGVDENFYLLVNPTYSFWPTPKWVWNNDPDGKGINSGTLKTFEVRQWMQDLKIKKEVVSGLDGTVEIDSL